eukprot:IDg20252t1
MVWLYSMLGFVDPAAVGCSFDNVQCDLQDDGQARLRLRSRRWREYNLLDILCSGYYRCVQWVAATNGADAIAVTRCCVSVASELQWLLGELCKLDWNIENESRSSEKERSSEVTRKLKGAVLSAIHLNHDALL